MQGVVFGAGGRGMKTFLLIITMASEADGDFHDYAVCATREAAMSCLSEWVKKEEEGMEEDPTGDVDAFFETSEAIYDIREMDIVDAAAVVTAATAAAIAAGSGAVAVAL